MAKHGQCRTFLERMKEHGKQFDWTLEQVADFWDAYMQIKERHEHAERRSVFGGDGRLIAPEPKQKQ